MRIACDDYSGTSQVRGPGHTAGGELFSSYIAWYLFLGGAGSGAYVIASLFNIVGRYSEKYHIR